MITPSEFMYYLGAGAYFTLMFLSTTMFADILPLSNHTLRNAIRFTCYGFILVKMMLAETFTLKRVAVYVVIALPILMCYHVTGYIYQLDMFMLIVGARGFRANRIVNLYFFMSMLLIAVTLIALAGGVIENRTFTRTDSDVIRNSVGFIYPTDFGARLFYTSLAFCALVGKRYNLAMLGIFCVISALLTVFCDARLDAALIVIVGILFYMNAKTRFFKRKWIERMLIVCVPFFFFLSYFVTMSYKKGPFFKYLDRILSKRLMYGYYNVWYTGIHPFGRHIYQQGHGALNYSSWAGYNFVDCGYLQALLEYGYVLMFFVLLMFVLISFTAIRRGQHHLAIIIFMIGLSSCVDHHFLEFWYDPFPLLIFSVIPYAPGYRKKSAEKVEEPAAEAEQIQKDIPAPKGLSHSHDVWGQLNMIQKKY